MGMEPGPGILNPNNAYTGIGKSTAEEIVNAVNDKGNGVLS